ncbi:hypothetical protein [Mangrovivirga cuniculi]|uniref:DUF4440 domain-containing protein n=1 Tax=Mangrovivirga cuniculi TaxID=2715131 RepID=A0A4D7JV16_9BACT|nr:hypothetical protein [Mangrovivirga cuniculi]QCK16422.1 hypothetical protein DCC35_17635 [Mangrovivirga cuniculi]
MEPVTSHFGVVKVHEKMLANGLGIKPSTDEVIISCNFAVEPGTVEMSSKQGKVYTKAQYLTLWKKIYRGWKIYRDVVYVFPAE